MNVGLSAAAVRASTVAASAAPTVAARSSSRLRYRLAIAAVCLLGVALVSRGVADEGAVSLDGDMPHYLMNGVFLYDLIGDAPLRAPLEYAQRYYARYPALTLGHHPFVPAIAEIPFFAAFGISVFSARLTTVSAFALLLVLWFKLIRQTYDTSTALFASLLLISTPGVVPLFQVVLSEPFALCLIVLSVYCMQQYCITRRAAYAAAFAASAALSAYAKHLAVFMFPVYLFQFVNAFGIRALFRRSTLVVVAIIVACILPLVPLTLKYSHWNMTIVTQFVKPGDRGSGANVLRFARWLVGGQFRLTAAVLGLASISVVGAALRRDRRIVVFGAWVVSVYVGLLLMGVVNDRFFCYWVPAFCALAAAAVQLGSTARGRAAWAIVLTATVGYQFWVGSRDAAVATIAGIRPAGATGYEEAARYVTENRLGDTILYSAAVDTGYFVFFVRKADPDHKMVVLRADKILTTSRMRISDFERRISRREEILPILSRYGVGHVVIEDRPYPDGPLRWLQETVEAPSFELRRRIPIQSSDARLTGSTLSIYQFNDRVPAAHDAALSIGVPLMNGTIQVLLADLIQKPGGR
jgi:hypothetical protein